MLGHELKVKSIMMPKSKCNRRSKNGCPNGISFIIFVKFNYIC